MTDQPNVMLFRAARDGDLDLVRKAIDTRHANFEARNQDGFTPFLLAVAKGHLEICRYLAYEHNANFRVTRNRTNALMYAMEKHNFRMIDFLVTIGLDLYEKNLTCPTAPFGFAMNVKNPIPVVQHLVENHKLDVNVPSEDSTGRTMLHQGVRLGNCKLVEYLLLQGANADVATCDGMTPLHVACELLWGTLCLEMVRILCNFGANVLVKEKEKGLLPLHFSCMRGNLQVVQFFFESIKVDEEITHSNDNSTILHYACQASSRRAEEKYPVVDFLLGRFQHLLLKQNAKKKTPFDVVEIAGYTSVQDYFRVQEAMITSIASLQWNLHDKLAMHDILATSSFDVAINADLVSASGEWRAHTKFGTMSLRKFRRIMWSFLIQNPSILTLMDEDGYFAIHIACKNGAPVELLGFLMEGTPRRVLTIARGGILPLHVACYGKASKQVLEYLIDQEKKLLKQRWNSNYPRLSVEECDHKERLPLHFACLSNARIEKVEYIYSLYEGAIAKQTRDAKLPIMLACEGDAPVEVVFFLLRAYPDGLVTMMRTYSRRSS